MKKKNKLIIIIVLFLLSSIFISKKFNFNIENIFKDIILYPYSIVEGKELVKDSNYLEVELANKEKEIKELKELLELNNITSSYKLINASIVSRNMEYFYDEVIINKGSNSGIKENMAVVNSKGLIGKIIEVNKYNSTVKLLTSVDMYNMLSIQIQLKDKYIYGILNNYDHETNSFIVEGIDENVVIEEGSLVSTTGLGNIYPSGIIVGKVVRIQKDNFDLAYILKVEPLTDFHNFHYVSVLDRLDYD